jgi:DNA repair exonuclease SbcCD ATPase subunit
MSFQYDRSKASHGDSFWTSYADLFLSLSFVFLCLFVAASLRQGTKQLQKDEESKQLSDQVADLKNQLKTYSALKDEYLQKQATTEEADQYEDLMKKLSLLQDDSKKERDELRNQIHDNEKKEQALNKYQQMIRNIVNANVLSKVKIQRRDQIINMKDEEISQQNVAMEDLQTQIDERKNQIQNQEQEIQNTKSQLQKQIKTLDKAFKEHQLSKTKYEKQLSDAKLKSQSVVAQLSAEKQNMESELQNVQGKLGETKGQLENVQGKLEKTDQELASAHEQEKGYQGKIADLQGKVSATKQELGKALELAHAKKNLANQIKKNFAKAGLKAEIDEGTGELILSFKESYFDTGKSNLKDDMIKTLMQAIPAYSQSLFEDEKTADKISSVEIIGFSSPTFKGKLVDPSSLDPKDKKAVNYNLDLSFNRAKSIFQHIFDTNKMTYKHQKRLLPLVKVTGRSFFANTGVDAETCKKTNCKKDQRVIIKFNLKD